MIRDLIKVVSEIKNQIMEPTRVGIVAGKMQRTIDVLNHQLDDIGLYISKNIYKIKNPNYKGKMEHYEEIVLSLRKIIAHTRNCINSSQK